jgi:hypothetical protein
MWVSSFKFHEWSMCECVVTTVIVAVGCSPQKPGVNWTLQSQ